MDLPPSLVAVVQAFRDATLEREKSLDMNLRERHAELAALKRSSQQAIDAGEWVAAADFKGAFTGSEAAERMLLSANCTADNDARAALIVTTQASLGAAVQIALAQASSPASPPASPLASQPAPPLASQPASQPAPQPTSPLASPPASQPTSQLASPPASSPASPLASSPASPLASPLASPPASPLASSPASSSVDQRLDELLQMIQDIKSARPNSHSAAPGEEAGAASGPLSPAPPSNKQKKARVKADQARVVEASQLARRATEAAAAAAAEEERIAAETRRLAEDERRREEVRAKMELTGRSRRPRTQLSRRKSASRSSTWP
jgi:hypothetical protein